MHKLTRALLALINEAAALGAKIKADLLALHINALTNLVEKADAEAARIGDVIDCLKTKEAQAHSAALSVAEAAVAEAAKHGVTLDV